jgi:heptosyltransferase-2
MSVAKPNLKQISRILVRGVNWVGDTILTYPTVQTLKTLYPDSHLAILVAEHLVDLWRTFPYVDEIITFQRKKGPGSFWEDLNLSQSIKKRKFDLAVILPRSFRSAFQIYLSGIPVRVGYESGVQSFLLTQGIPRTEDVLRTHRLYYYLKLTEPLGKIESIPSPRVYLREEDRRWAELTLGGLGILDDRLLIGMNPGATYGLAKCWLPERFGELGKKLSQRWKVSFFLFGKEEERPQAHGILKKLEGRGVDFVGKTSLLQLAALLERCHLLITNDTGTMHVAAAVNTPVVALFGSTPPDVTGPWGNQHRMISKEVSCSPCMKRTCPTDHRCMDLITVEEVEEVVEKKLKEQAAK